MSIPRQVMAAAAEADAVISNMRNGQAPAAEPPVTPPPQDPPPPTATPPAKDWEAECKAATQKWTVADSMLKRAGADIKELHAEIKRLTAELAVAKALAVKAPAEPAKPAPDLEVFSPEARQAVEYLAEERVAPLKSELEAVRKEREQREQEDARRRKEAEFVVFMDDFGPADWRAIDTSPEFAAWLAEFDPVTGKQRGQEYDASCQALDGRAAARLFKQFATSRPAPTPQPPPPPAPPVVPPVAGRAEAPSTPQGRIWTQAEIDQFYADDLKGRLRQRKMTPEQIEAVNKDILAAYREGRVRP